MSKARKRRMGLFVILGCALAAGCWNVSLGGMKGEASGYMNSLPRLKTAAAGGAVTITKPDGTICAVPAEHADGMLEIITHLNEAEGRAALTLADYTEVMADVLFTGRTTEQGHTVITMADGTEYRVNTDEAPHISQITGVTPLTGSTVTISTPEGDVVCASTDTGGVSRVTAAKGDYEDKINVHWQPIADPANKGGYKYHVYREPVGHPELMECLTGEPVTEEALAEANAKAAPYYVKELTGDPAEYISKVDLSNGADLQGGYLFVGVKTYISITANGQTKLVNIDIGRWNRNIPRSEVINAINEAFGGDNIASAHGSQHIKITSYTGDIVIKNDNHFPNRRNGSTDSAGNSVTQFFDPSGKDITVKRPTKQVEKYGELSYFTDTTAETGTHYTYRVSCEAADGSVIGFNASDEGYKKDALRLIASDGTDYKEVTLTVEATVPADHYTVERSRRQFDKQTLRFKDVTETLIGSDAKWTGREPLKDTPPAGLMTYKVTAYDAEGNITGVTEDTGCRAVKDEEFFIEFDNQMQSALDKIQLMHKSGMGKLGSEDTAGDVSGKCEYRARLSGLSGDVNITFGDYSDGYLIFSGTNHTLSSTSSGKNDGTVNTLGIYKGYCRYDITIVNQQAAGGYYYVSQNGREETQIPWDYRSKNGL